MLLPVPVTYTHITMYECDECGTNPEMGYNLVNILFMFLKCVENAGNN
jgi:hypothetical protein